MLHDNTEAIRTCIDPRRGTVRIMVSADGDGADAGGWSPDMNLRGDAGNHASEIIFEKLPAEIWAQVSPSVVSDALSRGIKSAYDPLNILNPGILG